MDALATEMPFWAQRKRENRSALRSGAHASEEISTYSQVGAGPQRDANRSRAVQHDPHALATPSTGPPDQTAQAQTAHLYVRMGLATHLLLQGAHLSWAAAWRHSAWGVRVHLPCRSLCQAPGP